MDSVRHRWAPQFRSNSLPTSKSTVTERVDELLTLPQQPQRTLLSSTSVQGRRQLDVLPNSQNMTPWFPLSAFLKDVSSPKDCAGYWLPRNPSPRPAPPPAKVKNPALSSTASPATPTQSAAAAAACCALVLSQNSTVSPSDAVRKHKVVPAIRAVPTTPSLSTNADPSYKRFPAFDILPFTPSPTCIPTTLPAPFLQPAVAMLPLKLASPQSQPSLLPTPTLVSTSFSPLPVSAALSEVPTIQSSLASGPYRPPPPPRSRSPWDWQEVSERSTISHKTPPIPIAAPIKSLYPSVYPLQSWTTKAASKDLFRDTIAVPTMLREKLAFDPSSPDVQKGVDAFLEMGHANGCWCSSSTHVKAKAVASSDSVTTDLLGTPQEVTKISLSGSRDLTLEETVYFTHVSRDLPDLLHDVVADSSDDDAVILTPTSENTESSFEELVIVEGIPHTDSDDDEWIPVLPHLRARRPNSLPSSRTVSNASVQTANLPAATPLPLLLLSSQQTPLVSPYQARASDAESETE